MWSFILFVIIFLVLTCSAVYFEFYPVVTQVFEKERAIGTRFLFIFLCVLPVVFIASYFTARRVTSAAEEFETALRASERRFRDIATSMADWIWEIDTEGKYIYSSHHSETLLGYVPKEIIGKRPFDFSPSEEMDKCRSIYAELFKERSILRNFENWKVAKDGRRICLITSAVPFFSGKGEFLGYRGVATDITSRKEAEKELAEKMAILERMNSVMVEREMDMVNLKETIRRMKEENKNDKPHEEIS